MFILFISVFRYNTYAKTNDLGPNFITYGSTTFLSIKILLESAIFRNCAPECRIDKMRATTNIAILMVLAPKFSCMKSNFKLVFHQMNFFTNK